MSQYAATVVPMPSYDSMYADFTAPARASLEDRRGFLLSYIEDIERDLHMAEQRLRMARHELDVTSKALENLEAGFDTPGDEVNPLVNRLPPMRRPDLDTRKSAGKSYEIGSGEKY